MTYVICDKCRKPIRYVKKKKYSWNVRRGT